MTARQPFTRLCQQLARGPLAARVDLHIHTNFSDGSYSPAEVVNLAKRGGLPALAITDHDTIAGLNPARQAAGTTLEVIAGIEISSQFQGRSLHLLGYFFQPDYLGLTTLLARLREQRWQRFQEMVERLARQGIVLETSALQAKAHVLGRRHLAELLVKAGRVASLRAAFNRYLDESGRVYVPHGDLPVADAIRVVREAAGVAAWAHPNYDCTRESLAGLRDQGLQAVEVDWPSCRPARARQLRSWAGELNLAVTGGSDCHGPDNPLRSVGAGGITLPELERLRELAGPF